MKIASSGLTIRALKRARIYTAEHYELNLGTEYFLAFAKLEAPDDKGIRHAVTQEDILQLMTKYRSTGPKGADWHVDEAYTTPEHQTKVYGIQITEMTLVDKETESWRITAKPVQEGTMGGEIWMSFDKRHEGVSAEYGK